MESISTLQYASSISTIRRDPKGLRKLVAASLILSFVVLILKRIALQGAVYWWNQAQAPTSLLDRYATLMANVMRRSQFAGHAIFDEVVFLFTLAIFGVTVWRRLRHRGELKDSIALVLLSGVAMILGIFVLGMDWWSYSAVHWIRLDVNL